MESPMLIAPGNIQKATHAKRIWVLIPETDAKGLRILLRRLRIYIAQYEDQYHRRRTRNPPTILLGYPSPSAS